ncbi:MAG: malonyl-ACP O-methyltransferase BioC [Pseudomonadota bacterium]
MKQQLENRQIRESFNRAAAAYNEAAVLQREVESRVLERLEYMPLQPERVLDLGSGLGRSTAELRQRYPEATVIGADLAHAMLSAQPSGSTRLCANAMRLPLASGSQDLVFSNLMLQWCNDLPAVFAEIRRVLKPKGLFLFTTFGPDTLMELRHAWSVVDGGVHVNDFPDMHLVGDALVGAGFDDPVMDMEHITVTYGAVRTLMRDLKTIGAHNVDARRRRSLTGKRRMLAMEAAYREHFERDGVVPATYEVVYGHALGPPPGRPRRVGGMEEVTIPVDSLRGSRRRR